jgi:hypothetical protein
VSQSKLGKNQSKLLVKIKNLTSCMSLSRSERNVHVKFEKSLEMPLSHLSNTTPSKVQRTKPTPSIFTISRPLSELMVLSM